MNIREEIMALLHNFEWSASTGVEHESNIDLIESFVKLKSNQPGWMNSSHYHCKKCRAEIIFLIRLPWSVSRGVRAVGICKECDLFFVEKEYGFFDFKWLGF